MSEKFLTDLALLLLTILIYVLDFPITVSVATPYERISPLLVILKFVTAKLESESRENLFPFLKNFASLLWTILGVINFFASFIYQLGYRTFTASGRVRLPQEATDPFIGDLKIMLNSNTHLLFSPLDQFSNASWLSSTTFESLDAYSLLPSVREWDAWSLYTTSYASSSSLSSAFATLGLSSVSLPIVVLAILFGPGLLQRFNLLPANLSALPPSPSPIFFF